MTAEHSLLIQTSSHPVGVRVEVSGPGTYANTVAYWRAIVEAVRERQSRALLLIDRSSGPALSEQEWKSLVDTLAGNGLERIRIAHVKPGGLQRVEYCELAAREAGYTARVFTDEAVASVWLRYGLSEKSA